MFHVMDQEISESRFSLHSEMNGNHAAVHL